MGPRAGLPRMPLRRALALPLDDHAAPEQPSRMSPPRLPTRTGDAWKCSFLFESARNVQAVSCRGGLVVAGGEELHLLRAGAQNMASRPPPLDIGPILVSAAEPRAPWRYAVASAELVAVFFRTDQGDQIVRLRCTPPGRSATHLAWGHAGGASALYIRWDDGVVVRMKEDMSGIDTTDLPPMDALASDSAGVLVMASCAAPDPCSYVTRNGEDLELRPLPRDLVVDRSQRVYLAVADVAVAIAVEHGGAFVSRAPETLFDRCAPLATAGPIEFEGPSSDAALFGAAHDAGVASIVRVDREGAAIRVAEFGSDAGPPELSALSWDGSRQMLWGASPQMGLVTCTAPGAKSGKNAVLS
jgi:hypothetical protein